MTSPPDRLVVDQSDPLSLELSRRHYEADCAFAAALARFQALGVTVPELSLASILKAAQPAFADGFCYLVRQDLEIIEVCLRHCTGAEETSIADAAALVSPALLLAGLLGIAVEPVSQAHEPENQLNAEDAISPDPQGSEEVQPLIPEQPEPEPEPDLMGPGSPAEIAGDHPTLRALTPEEIEAAVGMVKMMPAQQRKSFTIGFRNAFNISDTVTRIATEITQVRHLHYIDHFTAEAFGGIAA